MIPETTPRQVRLDLLARREIALVDLREEGPYALNHPLFAVCLPLGRIEMEALDRIPRKDVAIVLYDDGEGLVGPAAERLAALGYTRVSALAGGLAGWAAAGLELFRDVNSASKAFGELVEARRHTPSISAPEAKALIEGTPDLVVLDARRLDEYQTMSIPRGVSTPGAELVLRARQMAPDPATTIIVNCAGRTRSIIGAQSLINAGLPNPVMALRNGAIGWTLAGQTLDKGRDERAPDPEPAREAEARAASRGVAYRAGVRRIDPAQLQDIASNAYRTLYRFDVRTPEEYAAGHIPGFRNVPGGQLVQEIDMVAAVRGARIVLADDRGVRADMSASWLAQMGWDAYVLDGGFDGTLETAPWAPTLPPLPPATFVSPSALSGAADVVVVDLSASPAYRKGHVPGAWFLIPSRLDADIAKLPPDATIAVTSADGILAQFAAPRIAASSGRPVAVLQGGVQAWREAGLPLEAGATRMASAPDDVYRRPYEGTDNAVEAMQAYLDWEYGLVAQLERDGSHGFYVI